MRLVKTAAATWIPSARRSSSACEEISIAHATSPRVEHLAERALEVDRLRRRAHDRCSTPPIDRLDRPEQAAAAAGALEQRAHEERGRRLAVGAGDAATGSAAVGSPEARGGDRHRRTHVLAPHLGHAEPERARDDERRRPARDRVGREVVPVAGEAGHAEEQGAGLHRAVVVGQAGDLHAFGAFAEQVAQGHRDRSLRVGAVVPTHPVHVPVDLAGTEARG